MLRHERMSVAMALAESTHHSAQRLKTARAGGEAHVQEAPLPQGSRPPCLGEPRGPQDQDQLRTMEQLAAYAPMVQILDIPVPQLVDQLADVMRFFDMLLPVPEQVFEVHKILLDDVPVRTSVPGGTAGGSADDHILFFPAADHGAARPTFQFLVVEGDTLVSKVFFPDRVQQRRSWLWNAFLSGLRSRSWIFLFLMEAFKMFAQDEPRDQEGLDEPGERFFSHFSHPNKKSAKSGSHSSQRVPASVSPSTPAPQHRVRLRQWVMILDEYFWNMDTGEKRWQMEEVFNPRWWLRDGQYVDLGDI